MMRKTAVVNMLAGPGAGKTTCAWEIAAELKKHGIVTEYVSEYAKELVWDGKNEFLDGSLEHQKILLKEQLRRIDRLIGKVDVIVTDSPILLNPIYLKEQDAEYEKLVMQRFNQYNNINVFVQRNQDVFEQEGRIHNLQQSRDIDNRILGFMDRFNVEYKIYYHQNINNICVNDVVHRLNNTIQEVLPEEDIEL